MTRKIHIWSGVDSIVENTREKGRAGAEKKRTIDLNVIMRVLFKLSTVKKYVYAQIYPGEICAVVSPTSLELA